MFNKPIIEKKPISNELKTTVYRDLARAVIEDALRELDKPNGDLTAIQFFTSDMFSFLCSFLNVAAGPIRKIAHKKPGYIAFMKEVQSEKAAI
ncbi:MAG: hypothetical protein ACPKOP_11925 [Sphaerochaetaceae bacterium]